MTEIENTCARCFFGQRTMAMADLQRRRICGRFPPNIPMPAGPGGTGVQFMQPFVADGGWCGEWQMFRADGGKVDLS